MMNDYERVARIIRHIEANFREQPDLDSLAEVAGLSPSHFHRLFRRWAATTPKNFIQHLTAMEAGRLLRAGENVLDTALEVGLSGPGRLHDLCVNLEAASPGEIRTGGAGWRIEAGFCETPFGEALIATSPRGICKLSFLDGSQSARNSEWAEAENLWPNAKFLRDDNVASKTVEKIFAENLKPQAKEPLNLLVNGTAFQTKVWRALVEIPAGELRTYAEIASQIGSPRGARAVGSAVGSNLLGFVIPCHRVINATGIVGNYRWGSERKKAILAREISKRIDTV